MSAIAGEAGVALRGRAEEPCNLHEADCARETVPVNSWGSSLRMTRVGSNLAEELLREEPRCRASRNSQVPRAWDSKRQSNLDVSGE